MRIITSFCPQPTKQGLTKKLSVEKLNKSGTNQYADMDNQGGNYLCRSLEEKLFY